ncbi:uncharacterized protein LOC130636566 [Hydractinia symbiolongicarpus]|uniref:uncharacterized protein LOC130636566 n=1 Tax=Hydractinia symbiolongicarpus TaxID=13093 RepID=UPI0025510313|nr:uncharacterized protein LOC130636566 [Hydractinia symbiolongicarpus]
MSYSLWYCAIFMHLVKVTSCGNIFVSAVNGTDMASCGTNIDMCKTIKHAVTKAYSGDVIYLDGGLTRRVEYFPSEMVRITKSLTFIKSPTSKHKPVIIGSQKIYTAAWFDVSPKTVVDVSFIDFMNINIANVPQNGYFNLSYCTFTVTDPTFPKNYACLRFYSHGNYKTNSHGEVHITNFFISSPGMFISTDFMLRNNLSISIIDTTVTTSVSVFSYMRHHNVACSTFLSSLLIYNVTFFTTIPYALYINPCLHQVNISYTRFIGTNYAISIQKAKHVTIANCVFINTTGSVLNAYNVTYISIENSQFLNNTAAYPALRLINSNVMLKNTSHIATAGSVIIMENGTANITSCTFLGNQRPDYYIFSIESSKATLRRVLLVNNVGKIGGALRITKSVVNIVSSIISSNVAEKGGGIFSEFSNVTLRYVLVKNNNASNSGGAFFVNGGMLHVWSSYFEENRCRMEGGGVYLNKCVAYFWNCSIKHNFAGKGGGIYLVHSTVSVDYRTGDLNFATANASNVINAQFNRSFPELKNLMTTISQNNAPEGSGMYCFLSTLFLSNTKLVKNTGYTGAGIFAIKSLLQVVNSTVSHNTATMEGGGGVIIMSKTNLKNCSFKHNQAKFGGALSIAMKSRVWICKSTISSNNATLTAGLYVYQSSISVVKSNLKNNTSVKSPSLIYFNSMEVTGKLQFEMQDTTLIFARFPLIGGVWISAPFNYRFSIHIHNTRIILLSAGCGIRSVLLSGIPLSTNISFVIKCPVGYNSVHEVEEELGVHNRVNYLNTLSCKSCAKGTYSLDSGHRHVVMKSTKSSIYAPSHTIKCHSCPAGGICNEGSVISRDNVWAYIQSHTKRKEQVSFLPCSFGYCCSQTSNKCKSYSTCNFHREGILCGSCRKGYSVNYFTDLCTAQSSCHSQVPFWMMFILTAIMYTLLLLFMKEVGFFTKYYIIKLVGKFKKSQEVESFPLTEQGESSLLMNDEFIVIDGYPDQKEVDQIKSVNIRYITENSRFSGIFKIMVLFYQIKALINISIDTKKSSVKEIEEWLSSVLNLKIPLFSITAAVCPTQYLNAVSKIFIKEFLFVLFMLMFVMICQLAMLLHGKITFRKGSFNSVYFRFQKCALQISLLGYTIWAGFALNMINCQKINGKAVLYINGNITCFTWWQKLSISFLVLWIIPFPFTLWLAVQMLKKHRLSIKEFFLCVFIPLATLPYYLKVRCLSRRVINNISEIDNLTNMFEEPFRLNAKKKPIFWDSWRLFQRFIIAVFTTYFINPIQRLSLILPVMLVLLVVHLRVQPYKNKLVNWLETASLVSLCFLVGVNLFRSFVYFYGLSLEYHIDMVLSVFTVMEILCNPPVFLIVHLVIHKIKDFFLQKGIQKQE